MNPSDQETSLPAMRYGILCNSAHFQKWQAEAIRELISHGHILALLIMDGREQNKKMKGSFAYRYTGGNLLFRILHNRFFQPDAKKFVDLSSFLEGTDTLTCFPDKRKHS